MNSGILNELKKIKQNLQTVLDANFKLWGRGFLYINRGLEYDLPDDHM